MKYRGFDTVRPGLALIAGSSSLLYAPQSSCTDAGSQLRELANGEHRNERARDWQVGLALKRAEERHYAWAEGYTEWLEGKEAREEYYARLEELASLRG